MPPIPDSLSEDTVAAIATPPGRGAVALVRVSGSRAVAIITSLCPALSSTTPLEPRTARLLRVTNPATGETLDHALATFYPGPQSFTGEDSVEISTHGGNLVPQLVLAAAVEAGARLALPGEFTRRALLAGKLDLLQAEAILDLVNGTSPALHRAAIHQLERGLSARIASLRSSIVRVEALLSYGIDFPDEDEPPVPPERIVDAAVQALDEIRRMLSTAPQAEMLREGALVVLAGRPNAGKSSLFNALLGFDRSIVTELPGTTRDAVEAPIVMGGYPFRLVDTAGLRESAETIEGMGVEVARRYLAAADILLYCVDGSAAADASDAEFLTRQQIARTIVVRTKQDLARALPDAGFGIPDAVPVSSATGEGLADLAQRVVEMGFGLLTAAEDAPLLTRARHVRALRVAADELTYFLGSFPGVPPEFAATHLRGASSALEELIGIVATDDVLGAIFSEFCVGK